MMKKNICEHPNIVMIATLITYAIGIHFDIGDSTWGMIPNRLFMGLIMLRIMYYVAGREIFIWTKKSGAYAISRSFYQFILESITFVLCIENARKLNDNWLYLFISLFIFTLCVGFSEEVLFRGIIVNGLVKVLPKNKAGLCWVLVVSGFVFGFIHVWECLFNIGINSISVIVQMTNKTLFTGAFGMLLAAIYLKTRNIWICMIIHALNDFIASLAMLFLQRGVSNIQYVDVAKTMNSVTAFYTIIPVLLFSIPNIIISLMILKRLKPEECIFWK
ncbi:MAG: CPBP family intramembrane glutamic endopeptidase [Lachnospiraceae bacterium]|nr:CPBP family intramembrane glutamic endopeptidase [Lachnospiraceae bacterium]